jgi:hypothetical protein
MCHVGFHGVRSKYETAAAPPDAPRGITSTAPLFLA